MPRLAPLLLAATAAAHFSIDHPPQKSPSSESDLASGPCGGAALDFDSSVADFHVGGDAVAVTGSHPESNWLIRATNDTSGEDGWEQVFPVVKQDLPGTMCQPEVVVPEGWAGSQGLIGVAASAEDGTLFACSQVKFVEGTGDKPSDCKNTTSDISYTSDSDLEALVGDNVGGDSEDDDGAAAGLRAGLAGVGLAVLGTLVL